MQYDRGSIKWVSLMMPEHTEMLQEIWQEDGKTARPVLDEQQIAVLNNQLLEAYKRQASVCLRVYESGRITELTGTISSLDDQTGSVMLNSSSEPDRQIGFHDILRLAFI